MGITGRESHVGTGATELDLGVVRMQVESGISARAVAGRENGEPVFFAAGHRVAGEFRCAECGYGVIVRSVLPACPMCRGLVWEDPSGSPFSP